MKIFTGIPEMQAYIQEQKIQGATIGFVPTMGALHQGHLMLAERALVENELLICSIFVNPIQFNNPQDLEKYPRDFAKDSALLEQLGCHAVFYPSVEEMYPHPVSKVYDFGMLDKVMEGKFRPGHFNGVAIVVKRLFDIVQPHKAYFGEKDFQQLAIIKAMVKKEGVPVEIVPCPTVREADGLAMSSRNVRLNESQRKQAPFIYATLKEAAVRCGNQPVSEVVSWVAEQINSNPEMELEYFEIADPLTLMPLPHTHKGTPAVACIAVFMGQVRLIDNVAFNL